MSLTSDLTYHDISGIFTNVPANNTLLSTLNVFADRKTSHSPKVSFDILDKTAQSISQAVNRYGSEWSALAKRTTSNHMVEATLHAYTDVITAADVQPYRKPGTDLQLSVMDAVTASALGMYEKYMRTREKMFADALFRNTYDCEFTMDGPSLSWETEFGFSQSTGDLNTGTGDDPLESLDTAITAAKVTMGGLSALLKGFYLFCDPVTFKSLKYHTSIRDLLKYHVIGSDVLFNQEVLPAFSTFMLDSVRVVEVTDSLYGIGDSTAYLVPAFSKPLSESTTLPLSYIACSTSRNLELAFAPEVNDFNVYTVQDKFKNVEIFSESSLIPVCYRPDIVTLLTNVSD